jgi:hypothetical protein
MQVKNDQRGRRVDERVVSVGKAAQRIKSGIGSFSGGENKISSVYSYTHLKNR